MLLVRFADGSARERAAAITIDSRYDHSSQLIDPISVELPCISDADNVHLHEMLSLRAQHASATEILHSSESMRAYIQFLQRRIEVLQKRAPPVRPLPFLNGTTECFFRCQSKSHACYLDSTLQLLASMNALDCDAPPLWNDLRLDASRGISRLVHLLAEQVHSMHHPLTRRGVLQERARLRDIDEELQQRSAHGDALVALEHLLDMVCSYRLHVAESLLFRVKTRAALNVVTVQQHTMLHIRIPVFGDNHTTRKTDVEEALRATGQFFVARDDALALDNSTVAGGGMLYPAFDTEPRLGGRHTILIRVHAASPSTSFPYMLYHSTQIGTLDDDARVQTVNLSQDKSYVLRSIAVASTTGGLEGVYTRSGSQWWRMTRDVQDVTARLNPMLGKLPDGDVSICLLVYEMYQSMRTEGYYSRRTGCFVSSVTDALVS